MPNWDAIMEEATRLEKLLRRADIDFNEAEKALGYYVFKVCDDQVMERYLREMASNPPQRSNQTQKYYQEIFRVWQQWSAQSKLSKQDKARAWGWGVRMARAAKAGF